jgi:hypothetical protein
MDFAAAWTDLEVDDYVAVSDGKPEPSIEGGPAWFMWRSHNFTGKLIAKAGDAPHRTMMFELAPRSGAVIAYTIAESGGHSFAASTYDGFLGG